MRVVRDRQHRRNLPTVMDSAWADPEGITTDFVHYVMHLAANASGERCDLCAVEGPLQYAR